MIVSTSAKEGTESVRVSLDYTQRNQFDISDGEMSETARTFDPSGGVQRVNISSEERGNPRPRANTCRFLPDKIGCNFNTTDDIERAESHIS